ncbi:MAG: hypothetical protein JNM94_04030 [Phycisphaerae bacterium]|nr:hypothetical protein [Phycisphaerae bacterium]
MCYPFVLPAQVTFLLLVLSVIVAILVAPKAGARRWAAGVATGLVGVFLFVPTCIGVGFALDPIRYGEFHYATAKEAGERHGRLPPQAVDITLHAYASGHDARFTIDEDDLREWWRTFPPSTYSGPQPSTPEAVAESLPSHFGRYGWTPPRDTVVFEGPRAANAAGFTIWYSPSERVAYLSAAYW